MTASVLLPFGEQPPSVLSSGGTLATSRVGIIDIGSNSIRLVIYRAGGRLPHPQFNEREVCRLGYGVMETGLLDGSCMQAAYAALRRFAMIARHSQLDRMLCFATAAVRVANNGDEFLNRAEAILESRVRVLSGDEEAMMAANGIISGFPGSVGSGMAGIVGDLGGGSLELGLLPVQATADEAIQTASLNIGHLVMLDEASLCDALQTLPWLEKAKGRVLYAVGGTWRALATASIASRRKSIPIVHGLTMTPAGLLPLLDAIAENNGDLQGIPAARKPSMLQTVRITRAVLEVLQPEQMVFSGFGVREGILYDSLPPQLRQLDPLLTGVEEYAEMTQRFPGLGPALQQFILPFVEHFPDQYKRLAQACCYLADICWLEHPDYRAGMAIQKMMSMAVIGISHEERMWMAAVLSVRYQGVLPAKRLFRGMLNRKQRRRARLVGLVMRLAMTTTGGIPVLLGAVAVQPVKKGVRVEFAGEIADLSSALVERRLDAVRRYAKGKLELVSIAD